MEPTQVENLAVYEDAWRAWIEKGKRRDRTRKRGWRLLLCLATTLAILAVALYR